LNAKFNLSLHVFAFVRRRMPSGVVNFVKFLHTVSAVLAGCIVFIGCKCRCRFFVMV